MDYQYNPRGSTNYKKKIAITHNLRLLQIKAKEYKGGFAIFDVYFDSWKWCNALGYGLVYNFMLEEVLDYGPANVGKFAR